VRPVVVERVRALPAAAAACGAGRLEEPPAVPSLLRAAPVAALAAVATGIYGRVPVTSLHGRACRHCGWCSGGADGRRCGKAGGGDDGGSFVGPGAALPDVPNRLLAHGEGAGDGGGAWGRGMGGDAGELAEVDLDGLGTGEDGAWLGAGGGNGRDVEGGSGAGEDGREEAGPGLVAVYCGDELARPLVGVAGCGKFDRLTQTGAR
jgi:hypothetical protein